MQARMVDIRLYSLIKIAETGSYTKAGELLSLSQPAVSQHIRQLEEQLGVIIFEHAHNRITLTSEGEIVLKYARRMIALENNMLQKLKNERDQIRSITVGITHTAESSTIIQALAAYFEPFEHLNMKILTNVMNNLYSMLKNYEIDFAFVEGKKNDPDLKYRLLDTDRLVLVVAPEHPLASETMITLEQLRKERLILRLPNSNTRDLFNVSIQSQGLTIKDFSVAMEIDSIASIKDLIRHGFGVSVLAKSACTSELRKGTLKTLSIENMSMVREINIACHKDFEYQDMLGNIVDTYNRMQDH